MGSLLCRGLLHVAADVRGTGLQAAAEVFATAAPARTLPLPSSNAYFKATLLNENPDSLEKVRCAHHLRSPPWLCAFPPDAVVHPSLPLST